MEKPTASIGKTPKSSADNRVDRKGFLGWMTVGWLAFSAATGGFFTMIIRFLFPNVLFEPPQSFKIGFPDDFAIGMVDTRFKKEHAVWIVRNKEGLYALSTVCTHLGCTPNWLNAEQKFKCPCHGSGYDSEGINFEGPAPRPMDRATLSLDAQGQIVVDVSQLFQCPPGAPCQFNAPGAFIRV